MSLTINNIVVAGNLGQDPQIRFLANEKAVASFSLALNRKWKDANGAPKEKTTWVQVEAWGRTAELCSQYLTKGSRCIVVGHLDEDIWEDKQTGQKRSKIKVVADSVQFVDANAKKEAHGGEPAAEGQAAAPQRPSRPAAPATGSLSEDEPPF